MESSSGSGLTIPIQQCNKLSLHSVADCPSLLCEELEDVEIKNDQGSIQRRRRARKEELFKQKEDEKAEDEMEKEEKLEEEEEEEKEKRAVSEKEVMGTEGVEEKQVKPVTRLGVEEAQEAQEMQMEDKCETNKETICNKQENKERKGKEERDEKKKSRKRRGKKQSERIRNRRGLRDVSEQFEEKNGSQIQEVTVTGSEESAVLSEPSVGLMNSCDLSDPVYMGCGTTGLYCPPVPAPLLYSSQPPVPIQPVPSQPHGTKRPHSPLMPHGLPQQSQQPLEVRKDTSSGCLILYSPKIVFSIFKEDYNKLKVL